VSIFFPIRFQLVFLYNFARLPHVICNYRGSKSLAKILVQCRLLFITSPRILAASLLHLLQVNKKYIRDAPMLMLAWFVIATKREKIRC
jgi:hypothetical protein